MGNIYTDYEEETPNIFKIEEWQNLYLQKQAEIKKMELENEAILNSYLSSIRRIDLAIPMEYIESAWNEQKDKPRAKSSDYQYVIMRMEQLFFSEDDKPKLKEITPYGYDRYLYAFYYEINGHTIEIEIPNVERITSKNMYDMSLGKYSVLVQTAPYWWESISSSYNTLTIKADLHDAISTDFQKWEKGGKDNGKEN